MESQKDFCTREEDENNGFYVNLLKNPERFTGYDGEHAHKMWNAIYDENCFSDHNNLNKFQKCEEREAFYKIISGMHTSISTHIASEYFDPFTKNWTRNSSLFWERVGKFPERIENLQFLFSIMLRAVSKAGHYLLNYDFITGDKVEERRTLVLLGRIVQGARKCPFGLESSLFVEPEKKRVKGELQKYFKNISKIMNCLSCEKCRLWGKIQTQGIGTALKILYSYKNEHSNFQLKRSEVVSLINALNRFSSSLHAISLFQDEKQQYSTQRKEFSVFAKYIAPVVVVILSILFLIASK